MTSTVRPRVAGILCVLGVVSALSGRAVVLRGAQTVPAPELDRALRANDLQKARLLIPENWAAAEQLFVSYLERAFITPDKKPRDPTPRTLAGRLADVLFRVTEYDFHSVVVSALETADPDRRQQLMAVVRDHVSALERLRSAYKLTESGDMAMAAADRPRLLAEFTGIADRYRALSFPRGEWQALRNANNLDPDGPTAARAEKIADQLGDELYIVRKAVYTEEFLAMAERLGLPKHQGQILERLATQVGPNLLALKNSPEDLERAAVYREQARNLARTVPALETMNAWTLRLAAPPVALNVLPGLWSIYHQLHRPAQAQQALDEAMAVSRPFGESAVAVTLSVFASWSPSLKSDVAAQSVIKASQPFGAKVELDTLRRLSGSGTTFRSDLAERALALAVAIPDPHERAVTLAWYSRLVWVNSITPGDIAGFGSAPYRQLREFCLASNELELTADALANEAEVYVRERPGDPAPAIATYRQAIQLAERAGNSRKVAQIANRASEFPTGRVGPEDRIALSKIAAEAARKANDSLELARALRLGAVTVEDMQQAVALAVRYTEQSGNPAQELRSLSDLASGYVGRGDYQAGIDTELRLAERSRVGTGALARPGNSAERSALQQVVSIYAEIGEPLQARAVADRVRELLETTVLAGDRPSPAQLVDTYRAYETLGTMAVELGEPVAAVAYWDKALKKIAESVPSNSAQLSKRVILEERATLYARLGDFEASLKDWEDVLPLLAPTIRNFSMPEFEQKADWMAAVAWTHALAGNLDKALSLARDVITDLTRDTSGQYARRLFDGQTADDRAVAILLLTNHMDEAIAFDSAQSQQGPLARERSALGRLAAAYVKAGQLDNARSSLTAATDIDRKVPYLNHGGLGGSLLALGTLEIEATNYAEAKRCLLAARDAVNPYDVNRIWQIERALGVALARTGDLAGAEARYEAALTTLESIREQPRPEEFRLQYGFDRAQVYDEYTGLLAAKAAASGSQTDAVQAFQAAERKRTQALSALLATGWSRTPPEAMPDQVRRSRDMEALLSAKQGVLRDQFDQPPEKRDAVRIEKLQADVKQIQGDHARLLSSLAQGQYRFAAPTNVAASLAAPVQAALGPSRVLVEYLLMEDKSYAFVVSASGVKVVPLAVSRARVREHAEQLLAPFRQLRAGDTDLTRLTYDTGAAYALYQAVFAPVRAALGPATEILIVPDDVLQVVPFEALVERQPRRVARGGVLDAGFADEAFLIRRYAMSYLTTSAELLPTAEASAPSAAPRRLFVLANPTAGVASAPAPAQDNPLKRQFRSAEFAGFLTSLPSAEAEAQRIARVFAPDASTILTRDKATETAYASQAGQYDIVHFATHGVASDGQPLYSTLVLAPDAPNGSDGFLQAYEVLRTPLRASLVVLGGCETALGGGTDWGQGLVGLVAAFQQAGARQVLATLWTIDEATAEMMSAFYEALAQGQSASAALRQAKLHLLQQRVRMGQTEISLAHPFFWAPFKLVGAASR